MNEWVNSAAPWGAADANVNTKLAPDVSTCGGHLADMSSDCGDVNCPMDFRSPNGAMRGHTENV